MARLIAWSVVLLALIWLVARSCGLTPQQMEDQLLLAELNSTEGAAYRAANGVRPGVLTLPNGLQVEWLEQGDGAVPAPEDWVRVHYRGWHIDGREFDNTWRRGEPATVAVAQTIAGWHATLVSLPAGSRVRLVLPPELAYGRGGGGHIGPEETLIFELQLLEVTEPPASQTREEWEKPVPNLR
jgi:FKBP-type peptidyl-prolyl cis-trans isomerase FkpA